MTCLEKYIPTFLYWRLDQRVELDQILITYYLPHFFLISLYTFITTSAVIMGDFNADLTSIGTHHLCDFLVENGSKGLSASFFP